MSVLLGGAGNTTVLGVKGELQLAYGRLLRRGKGWAFA
jgi:hypothetical protein